VKSFGFDKAVAGAHDLFSLLETGKLTATQVGDTFTKVFAELIPEAIDKTTGLASKSFVDLQRTALDHGTSSPALDQFRTQQTSGAVGGLNSFLNVGNSAASQAAADQQKLIDLSGQLAQASQSDQAKIQQAIQQTTKDLQTQQSVVTTNTVQSQSAATAVAGGILAAFTELQRGGASVTEALAAVSPAVTGLGDQLTRTGLDGGTAFQTLQGYVALAGDAIAGPALDAVGGLGQALAGLNNTGLLTQDMFTGLTGQVTGTFNSLIAQGKTGNDVLHLMQPTLQQIWQLQQDFGYSVDEGTQALLDQAVAAGTVGEKQKPIQQQQLDAANKQIDATNRLVDAIKSLVPASKTAADGISDHLAGIKVPKITIPYDFSGPDRPSIEAPEGAASGGIVTAMGIRHMAEGGPVGAWPSVGTDTVPAMLTPKEWVVNDNQQQHLADVVFGNMTPDNNNAGMLDAMQKFHGEVSGLRADLVRRDEVLPVMIAAEVRKVAGGRR
jgi:hypothetical protein